MGLSGRTKCAGTMDIHATRSRTVPWTTKDAAQCVSGSLAVHLLQLGFLIRGMAMARPGRKNKTAEAVILLITTEGKKAFYNSGLWKALRRLVLKEQHHECQLCKAKGIYTEAVTVHHIEPILKRPDLALTKSNCMAICDECHYQEHHGTKPKPQLNEERW